MFKLTKKVTVQNANQDVITKEINVIIEISGLFIFIKSESKIVMLILPFKCINCRFIINIKIFVLYNFIYFD